MSLQVETKRDGKVLVVLLTGELDHHTAPIVRDVLEKEMAKDDTRHMLLNMKQLTFMDSSGIGMILGRYKQLLQKGGKMGICDIPPSIHRLLEMSGLFKIMMISDTEQHAISRLEVES
jgi:stage II sporulation protein AA (anti-sigma F factor antagonist)